MRHKHITLIGTFLITIFCILAGIMYYFNQDSCPIGSFLCKNSSVCMPQHNWCNGVYDCPEHDDEDVTICFDYHGSWGDLVIVRDRTTTNCSAASEDIYDPFFIKDCQYHHCHQGVNCSNLKTIPSSLFPDLRKMILNNNSFSTLPDGSFSRFQKLRILDLEYNAIKHFETNVFSQQSELIWLFMSNNKIKHLQRGLFNGLKSLEKLEAKNNEILIADFSDFKNSATLGWVYLSNNRLSTSTLKLPFLPELKELNLDSNQLDSITEDLFSRLPKLESLSLEGNDIVNIDENAFQNLSLLVDLNLARNKIITIPYNVFRFLDNLAKLSIGYNPIDDVPSSLFDPLINLESLDVQDLNLDNLQQNVFNSYSKLAIVYFKKFHYCMTYAPKVKMCRPASDGVSSLSHLIGKPVLRIAVWGISCATCLGNALVLWGRFTAKDENQVLSIVIRNLAVSDMLMGVYLLIIGLEDLRSGNNYMAGASTWISSWPCTLIGMLAMISSEVSVLILLFMSVERFMLIAMPWKSYRSMTPQTASSSMIILWVIGLTLALIPVIHWRSSTRFYGVNGMCFPLHIEDPFLIGWEYSAFIFLGLNLLGLLTIIYVYIGMFISIWRTRHATPLSVGESEFAVRFFLIVLTDAICWAPIIILKILALANYPVSPDLHAWVVIFILPVNSAVNPLLYTFTTPKFRERLSEGLFSKMQRYSSYDKSSRVSDTKIGYLKNSKMMRSLSNTTKNSFDQPTLTPISTIPETRLICELNAPD